jgi:hypothetical protein
MVTITDQAGRQETITEEEFRRRRPLPPRSREYRVRSPRSVAFSLQGDGVEALFVVQGRRFGGH